MKNYNGLSYMIEILYTNLVDKYKVREFISQTIGEEYLIPY